MDELIASWPYSGGEVRVRVTSWRGKQRADLRYFYADEFGECHPTAKGLSVPLEDLGKLRAALKGIEDKEATAG